MVGSLNRWLLGSVHAFLLAAALLAAPARAQDLKVGSAAPPLELTGQKDWVRGEPLPGLEKGKVYVVEFFATWCPPCRASMPHLIQLQEKYQGRAEIVAVASFERTPIRDMQRDEIRKLARKLGAALNFRMGHDFSQDVARAWMEASGSTGLPTAFIVDRDGRIAYIGPPGGLDGPLEEVVAGTWSTGGGQAAHEAEREAEHQATGTDEDLLRKGFVAQGEADWAFLLEVAEAGLARSSAFAPIFGGFKLKALLNLPHREREGVALAQERLHQARGDAPALLSLLTGVLDFQPAFERTWKTGLKGRVLDGLREALPKDPLDLESLRSALRLEAGAPVPGMVPAELAAILTIAQGEVEAFRAAEALTLLRRALRAFGAEHAGAIKATIAEVEKLPGAAAAEPLAAPEPAPAPSPEPAAEPAPPAGAHCEGGVCALPPRAAADPCEDPFQSR